MKQKSLPSTLAALEPAQLDRVHQWLDDLDYNEIIPKLMDEFDIETSSAALCRYNSRRRIVNDIQDTVEAGFQLPDLVSFLKGEPTRFDAAAIQLIFKRVLERAADQNTRTSELKTLFAIATYADRKEWNQRRADLREAQFAHKREMDTVRNSFVERRLWLVEPFAKSSSVTGKKNAEKWAKPTFVPLSPEPSAPEPSAPEPLPTSSEPLPSESNQPSQPLDIPQPQPLEIKETPPPPKPVLTAQEQAVLDDETRLSALADAQSLYDAKRERDELSKSLLELGADPAKFTELAAQSILEPSEPAALAARHESLNLAIEALNSKIEKYELQWQIAILDFQPLPDKETLRTRSDKYTCRRAGEHGDFMRSIKRDPCRILPDPPYNSELMECPCGSKLPCLHHEAFPEYFWHISPMNPDYQNCLLYRDIPYRQPREYYV